MEINQDETDSLDDREIPDEDIEVRVDDVLRDFYQNKKLNFKRTNVVINWNYHKLHFNLLTH